MNPLALLYLAGATVAATIRIDAKNLAFEPSSVTAAVGDILEFHFLPNNHSVVMGDFDNPCQPVRTGGFFSGYHTLESGEAAEVFRVVVNNTEPIWLYCSKTGHCRNGMVGVVNPTAEKTLEKYSSAAKAFQGTEGSFPAPFGGVTVANAGSSVTSTTASAASATSTGTGTSAAASATSSTTTGAGNRQSVAVVGGVTVGLVWATYALFVLL